MKLRGLLVCLLTTIVLVVSERAHAEPSRAATFALIVGSNRSVDANLAPLRYADDDAARYLDLFRLLGARTYLLTRLDENTLRLHPQAAAEALEPRKARLDEAVAQLVADVDQAAARGVETVVYFVYAGHGNVENGKGYITLEDQRITGEDLAALFARVHATRIHVIADACGSYYLAYSRGPGGQRRQIEFGLTPALIKDPRVGLLLSTSSARESHEWDAFQSGVFSHEVRSGLYGAADADGDGVVSYREIAAFVARANASVPNEKYRPDVHTRAPGSGDALLDLRRVRGRRLEIDGTHAGHYLLEDARGVRIADVHNAAGQTLSLVRPPPSGRVFLRRVDDDTELVVDSPDPLDDVVRVADLTPEPPRTASRGAAHESFGQLFALPFDRRAVEEWREPPPPAPEAPPPRSIRRPLAYAALGAGALAIGAGVALSISANTIESNGASSSQLAAARRNEDISARTTAATAFYVGGGVAAAAGVVLLLWPETKNVQLTALPGGAYVGYGTLF